MVQKFTPRKGYKRRILSCSKICLQYKFKRENKQQRFYGTAKKCMNCNIYIVVEGKYCPCCNYQLRWAGTGKKPDDRKRID